MIELISLMAVAIGRGVLFPDFGSSGSIVATHFGAPIAFAAICVCFAPSQRNRPSWKFFAKGVYILVATELVGLSIYAVSGGLRYLLGADFTPVLIALSMVSQLLVYCVSVHWLSGSKYARAP